MIFVFPLRVKRPNEKKYLKIFNSNYNIFFHLFAVRISSINNLKKSIINLLQTTKIHDIAIIITTLSSKLSASSSHHTALFSLSSILVLFYCVRIYCNTTIQLLFTPLFFLFGFGFVCLIIVWKLPRRALKWP